MDNVPVHSNRVAPTSRNMGDVYTNSPDTKRKPKKNKKVPILFAAGAIVLFLTIALSGWFVYRSSMGASIDGSKYQAVFFTNGQVYFGKLQPLSGNYMKLTNIYYLQAQTDSSTTDPKNPQETSTQQASNVQLIKLGSEIHGPVDEMIISKDQVLFFENLKKDGKVTDSIGKYQTQK